jgi:hypothetical protein
MTVGLSTGNDSGSFIGSGIGFGSGILDGSGIGIKPCVFPKIFPPDNQIPSFQRINK